MVFKVIVAVACIAVASGSGYTPAIRVYNGEPLEYRIEEFDPHPQYTYIYGGSDVVSGDSQTRFETRVGDPVQGEYLAAGGSKGTVKYIADDINGFNIVADRGPIHKAVSSPIVGKSTAPYTTKFIQQEPIAYAAPYLVKSAPIAYAAPTVIKQAPVDYVASSQPINYETRSVFKPRLVYSSDSSISRSLPFGYSAVAPTLIRSASNVHSAPVGYTLVKSVPAAYGNW